MRSVMPLGVLVLVGCNNGEAGRASPQASSAPAAATASSTASAATEPAAPYHEVGHFGPRAAVFDAGKRMIACEDDCAVPLDPSKPMPKITVVEASGSHEDAALSIEGAHGVPRKKFAENKLANLRIDYFAKEPDKLFARYSYDHQGEGGYEKYDFTLRLDRGKWVNAQFEHPDVHSDALRGPDLDAAFAHLPWPSSGSHEPKNGPLRSFRTMVFGGGGPVLAMHDVELATWDGKAWKREPAPWKEYDGSSRLANGSTLVIADGRAWLWPPKDKPRELAIGGDAKDRTLDVHAVDGAAWIVARTAEAVSVWAPSDAAALPTLPADKGDAPKLDDHDAAEPMPAAANLAPGCATPFATIASAKRTDLPTYELTREGLKGHGELQDVLTFVDFKRDGVLYFGAQANTEEALHSLTEILEKNVKGMKPVLGCLDAKTHVNGGPTPAKGAYRVVLNLQTGEFVARR